MTICAGERITPHERGDRDRLPVGFTLKGRTAGALLERMSVWHTRTVKIEQGRVRDWESTGREGLALSKGSWRWQLRELTTAKELSAEGAAMRHCVATYAPSCARGSVSIWSLQVQGPPTNGGWLRVMTIAISRQGQITEARGWCNAIPSADGRGSYMRLASDEHAVLLRARQVVQRWATQENLILPDYLR
ncbi:MAG: PcfJ domain-containing protein [Armatimonas sp.]